ncbi:hypothetical protein PLICRDRAFT_40470 [Plicaturopsis crispa FD-325 SS-3]|nr:hypothetical protein PLICRDRAFT_40470 [Plicaturopsis crispa FD-325 SS-3]
MSTGPAFSDTRVIGYDPLIQPALLHSFHPPSPESLATIADARAAAAAITAGTDPRVLVIVGPCSIHSPEQALEYARLLRKGVQDGKWPHLLIVMRAYFEKPRTTTGWKGLINDPHIDGSFDINSGLRTARSLLCSLTSLGVPVGSELLDTIGPQYVADLISWGAIGARTTESQLHRELASGCSFPIGFKNGTDGSITVATDAMRAASAPHAFMGVTPSGLASIVRTRGNRDVHLILRGGARGPNFDADSVRTAVAGAQSAVKKISIEQGPAPETNGAPKEPFGSVMIDCSHGNSQKNHLNQARVLSSICAQLVSGEAYARHITGVMIESHLRAGRQDVPAGYRRPDVETRPTCAAETNGSLKDEGGLEWGVSITDACVDWDMTVGMLDELNEAVKQRSERGLLNGTAHLQNGH